MPASPVIESSANPACKLLRSLQRRHGRQRERAFVLEGTRAVADALDAGIVPRLVAVSADFPADHLPDLPPDIPLRVLAPALFATLAGTEHPQGILAVVPFPELPVSVVAAPLILVVDGVRDPGNLGTLLRSAAAGGVDQAVLMSGTVDPWNPKVVRAAMGAHLRLPIHAVDDAALAGLVEHIDLVALTDADGDVAYDEVDWTAPAAIIVGGEAEGATATARDLATVTVRIPLARGMESLNAGVAGSLVIFEANRQRRWASRNG